MQEEVAAYSGYQGGFDLEDRTLRFAKQCLNICQKVDKNQINGSLIGQMIRSSTSIGANYREANQTLTKKDFYYRINVCRKESKETKYWLDLLLHSNVHLQSEIGVLIQEAFELTRIFSSIVLRNK